MLVIIILLLLVVGIFFFKKNFTIKRKTTISSQNVYVSATNVHSTASSDSSSKTTSDILSVDEATFEYNAHKKAFSMDPSVTVDIDERKQAFADEQKRINGCLTTINIDMMHLFLDLKDMLKHVYRQRGCDCKKIDSYETVMTILEENITAGNAVRFFTVPVSFQKNVAIYPTDLMCEFVVANQEIPNFETIFKQLDSLWEQMESYLDEKNAIKRDLTSLDQFCEDNAIYLNILKDSQQ